jgi:hypothetical protein
MDGQKWFTMAIRWDDKIRTAWIGDKFIEKPHEHGMGFMPIDICAPFPSDNPKRLGHFYLEDLVPLQAELNDAIKRRSNIVKRMSNPILWARNMKSTTSMDDVKAAMQNAEAGVVGLGKEGEVGLLQLQELRILDNHIAEIKSDMQRLSGFAAASFGETVGANTSGDALGMYFTPTQKHIDDQNISWKAFYESIHAKILRLYDVFGKTNETFKLQGYSPRSTVEGNKETGYHVKAGGDYALEFTRDVINGNYLTRCIPVPVIPKNEIEEKRFWLDAANQKIVSRNTAYENFGLESPEDEKQQLILEQSEPMLNPDGIGNILQQMQQQPVQVPNQQTPAPALPAPPNLAPAGVASGA